ncbi:hypothetical protein CTI14_05750, partial [Methylobacterium radiotolerans]
MRMVTLPRGAPVRIDAGRTDQRDQEALTARRRAIWICSPSPTWLFAGSVSLNEGMAAVGLR